MDSPEAGPIQGTPDKNSGENLFLNFFRGGITNSCFPLSPPFSSHLRVTRVSDGSVLELDGNLKSSNFPDPVGRYYFFTVLSDQSYKVEIVPPRRNKGFKPKTITAQYADSGECGRGLHLRFKQENGQLWEVPQKSSSDFRVCQGAQKIGTANTQFQTVCSKGQPWLEASLSPSFSKTVKLIRGKGQISCSSPQ